MNTYYNIMMIFIIKFIKMKQNNYFLRILNPIKRGFTPTRTQLLTLIIRG